MKKQGLTITKQNGKKPCKKKCNSYMRTIHMILCGCQGKVSLKKQMGVWAQD